jgi:cyanate lyase
MTLLMLQAKQMDEAGFSIKNISDKLGKTEQWVQAVVGLNYPEKSETKEDVQKPEEVFVASPEFILMRKTKDLSDKGLSNESIIKEVGRKESWILGTIAIMNRLPKSIHDAMERDKISRTTALQLIFAPTDKMDVICEGAIKLCETEKL